MLYQCRLPAPPLDAHVEALWICRADPRPLALERVLPNGAPQLVINLAEDAVRTYDEEGRLTERTSGLVLSGVRSRAVVIDTAEQQWVAGVSFRPGGTLPFARVAARELCDVDVPLDALWGWAAIAELRDRLLSSATPQAALDVLEGALRARFHPRAAHPAVSQTLALLARPGGLVLRDVVRAVGLSHKRLIERFKDEVGLPPKQYGRLLRFQRAVTRAYAGGPVRWALLALECGYSDQAHFTHDFRAFAGLTPTQYDARRTGFQNHVKFFQDEAAGG